MNIYTLPHRPVLALAIPMIFSNLSIPLLGIVDTALLGHLDSPIFLAGVAVGTSIISFLFWGLGFLRMGTTGLIAQAVGRENTEEQARIFFQSCVLALGLATLVVALGPLLIPWIIEFMAPKESLVPIINGYSRIRLWGAPAVLLTYVGIGWFIGQQNTRSPLFIMVTINLLNIALDYLFIVRFEWNSNGAAWATVIAEYSGLLLTGFIIARRSGAKLSTIDLNSLKRLNDYGALIAVNRHLFFRTILLLTSLAFFTAQGAQQGPAVAAANAILMQLIMLVAYGLDGFAHASEAMVGKYAGARQRGQLIDVIVTTGLWSLGCSLLMTVLYALVGHPIIGLFSDIHSVQSATQSYFGWLLILPLVSAPAYWLDGIYIGLNQTRAMLISMVISTLMIYLPVWWLSQGLGNHGLWMSFTLLNLFRSLTLMITLKKSLPQSESIEEQSTL